MRQRDRKTELVEIAYRLIAQNGWKASGFVKSRLKLE
jgi:hypothetical protein